MSQVATLSRPRGLRFRGISYTVSGMTSSIPSATTAASRVRPVDALLLAASLLLCPAHS
jgi:hypothetical protein